MVLEPAATPVNPKKPAMSEITKKMMAHVIMAAPFRCGENRRAAIGSISFAALPFFTVRELRAGK